VISVDLFTKEGGFVVSVKIPNFLAGREPEVVIWGDRVFVKHSAYQYREVFAYTALV
jgi:hypothetical protein